MVFKSDGEVGRPPREAVEQVVPESNPAHWKHPSNHCDSTFLWLDDAGRLQPVSLRWWEDMKWSVARYYGLEFIVHELKVADRRAMQAEWNLDVFLCPVKSGVPAGMANTSPVAYAQELQTRVGMFASYLKVLAVHNNSRRGMPDGGSVKVTLTPYCKYPVSSDDKVTMVAMRSVHTHPIALTLSRYCMDGYSSTFGFEESRQGPGSRQPARKLDID